MELTIQGLQSLPFLSILCTRAGVVFHHLLQTSLSFGVEMEAFLLAWHTTWVLLTGTCNTWHIKLSWVVFSPGPHSAQLPDHTATLLSDDTRLGQLAPKKGYRDTQIFLSPHRDPDFPNRPPPKDRHHPTPMCPSLQIHIPNHHYTPLSPHYTPKSSSRAPHSLLHRWAEAARPPSGLAGQGRAGQGRAGPGRAEPPPHPAHRCPRPGDEAARTALPAWR